MAGEAEYPELIRDEDPWQGLDVMGSVHLRVWQWEAGRLTAVISGPGAMRAEGVEEAFARLRAEYPQATVELFHHHPGDWIDMAFYAELAREADGSVTRTQVFGNELARRLGPSLYATEDPEDETGGYGGP
ncbi:hypothetical protein [Streptomyces griseosporeus]|uniref:hypothetical protein n=1 Tax=Streptomyces griseosporeus TaxID=1910 RepID=UPI00167E2A95|nr:hypothetical protein [Streptomyces griseosporeus]GHF38681.1 hypothetical protein GCM10018783_03940 [Streptomyces griseosporeus]